MYMAETGSLSDPVEVDDKGLPGHGSVTFDCFVSEEGAVSRRVIDREVLVQGIRWVHRAILSGPVDFLA